MTIILFLVDSSASMAQKNYMGCSALDTAKSVVGDILKLRQRDINNRQTDRYMLFSTEEFPFCVKAGWKEGSGVFHDQLKALRPCGKSPLKQAILAAFQFVNLNRAQTGVDYYGHGRFPHLQESLIIITISDGSAVSDLPSDFELRSDPKKPTPGSEYTEEAFRWDQRIFSIVIRMGARTPAEPRHATCAPVHAEPGVIQRVCASTGGRSFTMVSHKQQAAVIEQLTQAIHINGIVVRFEYSAPALVSRNGAESGELSEERKAELSGEALRLALEARPITFVLTRNRAPGHWPIPEAFWPDSVQNSGKLPVRQAHPMLTIGVNSMEAQVNTEFPFDKYELESACPLSDFIRDRTAALGNANVCWQVYVTNSFRTAGPGKPFGFLKTATNGTSVNLFLMPYNYPMLLRLLDEQKADARLRSHPDWRRKLDQYFDSCPSYYKQQLKKALLRLKLTGGVLDEPAAALYSPHLNKALTNMKSTAKDEMEKLLMEVGMRLSKLPRAATYRVNVERREPVRARLNFRIEWEEEKKAKVAAAKVEEPERKKPRSRLPIPANRLSTIVIEDDIPPDPEMPEPEPLAAQPIPNLSMDLYAPTATGKLYSNPFSIERGQLVQMLPRLRLNLDQQIRDSPIPALEGGLPGIPCKLQTAYELHSQEVSKMGNYDEYVRAAEMIGAGPLREVEHRAVRENTFGNPFKKDKKSMAVDEVGEAPATTRESAGLSKKDRKAMEGNRPPRRKAGPLAPNSMQMWRERRRTNSMSSVSDLSHTAEDLGDDLSEAEASSSAASLEMDDVTADLAQLGNGRNGSAKAAAPAAGTASPVHSTGSSRDSGMSEWGLEDEAEEEEEEEEGEVGNGGLADDDDDDDDLLIINEDEDDDQPPPPSKKPKLAATSSRAESGSTGVVSGRKGGSRDGRWMREGRADAGIDKIRELKGEVCRVVRLFLADAAMLSKMDALFAALSIASLIIMTRFARDEAKRFKKRWLVSTLERRLIEMESLANGLS